MGKFSIRDMMTEPVEEQNGVPSAPIGAETPRTIDDITVEINFYKSQTAQNIIEIGKRLIEAKGQLAHGDWLPWLRDKVDLTASTAQRFMQIAREFSNAAPVRHLNYTQVLALLQVPAEEREKFIAESHVVDGQEKSVSDMSKRELETVIKERDTARREADSAKKKAKEMERCKNIDYKNYMEALCKIEKMEEAEQNLEIRRQMKIRELESRLREYESRPIDVAVQEISSDERARMRNEIRSELATEQEAVSVPLEMLTQARVNFMEGIQTACETFILVAQLATIDAVPGAVTACVGACDEMIEKLKALEMRANNILYQGDTALPPEGEDD